MSTSSFPNLPGDNAEPTPPLTGTQPAPASEEDASEAPAPPTVDPTVPPAAPTAEPPAESPGKPPIASTVTLDSERFAAAGANDEGDFSVRSSEPQEDDKTIISSTAPYQVGPAAGAVPPAASANLDAPPYPAWINAKGPIEPGTTLGHFVIRQYIGGGGMGRVFEAVDETLDRRVAIKLLPLQRAKDSNANARFLNEARSAARLNHENIAQVYYFGEENNISFIAFEFVEGINVRQWVNEHGPMPVQKAIRYMIQIADALAHAATHGVIHRDVKPSNIILTENETAKLIDMGLARLFMDEDQASDELTASGVTLGTFDYISPEQAKDPRISDSRSDIYSLGCTLFFMLAGRPPFPEGTPVQKLLMHQGDKRPDLHQLIPRIPNEVSNLVQKMMEIEPEKRYQSPQELCAELARIAPLVGLAPSKTKKGAWVAAPIPVRKKSIDLAFHLPWITTVLLLLAGAAGYRFWSISRENNIPLPRLEPQTITTAPVQMPETASPPAEVTPEPSSSLMMRVLGSTVRETESNAFLSGEFSLRGTLDGRGESSRQRSGLGVIPLALTPALSDSTLLNEPPEVVEALRYSISPSGASLAGSWSLAASLAARADVPILPGEERNYPVLSVDRAGEAPGSYATLSEALARGLERKDENPLEGIVIELAYEGTMEVGTLDLPACKLSLVARDGFRPVLAFVPQENDSTMFRLEQSDLTLSGVAIDFSAPTRSSKRWSLFELNGNSSLAVKGTVLTIQNDSSSPAPPKDAPPAIAFVRALSPDGEDSSLGYEAGGSAVPYGETSGEDADSAGKRPFRVEMDRVLVRGEAAFCSFEAAQDCHIALSLSGFCLTAPLISVTGQGVVSASLDRITGFCHDSLFRTVVGPALPDQGTQAPGPRPESHLSLSVTHSLLRMRNTPLAECLCSGDPFAVGVPRWHLSESIICGGTSLLRVADLGAARINGDAASAEAAEETPGGAENSSAAAQEDTDQNAESVPEQTARTFPGSEELFRPIEEDDAALRRLEEIPPHRMSLTDMYDTMFRPIYDHLRSPQEREILESIETGVYTFERPAEPSPKEGR
ncbi:MAG: serine/threonine protein kinase [Thermoguttaceae bacterium]|nr:serine/threonine protein kinase [Thermoguttaceae bacterium]